MSKDNCMDCGEHRTNHKGLRHQFVEDDRDVHTEHCCLVHGCKYGKDDCSVETGKKVQSYPCESCEIVRTPYDFLQLVIMPLQNAAGHVSNAADGTYIRTTAEQREKLAKIEEILGQAADLLRDVFPKEAIDGSRSTNFGID